MKRILSLLLVFALSVGFLSGAASAAAPRPETRLSAAAQSAAHSGSADETVRVIVTLEGEPAARTAEQTRSAASRRIALQHAALRGRLAAAGVACTLDFDYSVLLNGMALTLARGDLEKLAAQPGVRSVHVANRYAPPETVLMESANQMTDATLLHREGVLGSGTVIAVLDTGVSAGHEAFGVYGEMLDAPKLSRTDAEGRIERLERGVFLSQKIPFAYDYADLDNDASDDAAGESAGHGTHVAGIAAGYAEGEDGSVRFRGAAPDAQLLVMKIFSSYEDGGTDSAIYFKALEDAYALGADIVNLSLGAPNGFSYDPELENEVCGDLFDTLRENGVLVTAAAGNHGSMADHASNRAQNGFVSADYADYGVLASPASYGRNLAVASAENTRILSRALSAEGRDIRFWESAGQFYESFRPAGTAEYVVIPGFGRSADYAGLSARGRIALVARGEISFAEKLACAENAGAAALLVYNNEPGELYMALSDAQIPAAAISQADGEYLVSLAEAEEEPIPVPDAGESQEDLSFFYPVTRQDELIPGQYLIVSEHAGLAFNPAAANLNASGNWLEVPGFRKGIPAEGRVLSAALDYEENTLRSDKMLNCSGTADEVLLTDETAENLQIMIRANGTADIRCRGCGFRYNEAEEVFRFYRPGSPLLEDAQAAVSLYRRGPARSDPSLVGALSFPDRFISDANVYGGELSGFSSMGVTPELELKPSLTAVGGSVCSAAGGTTDGYTVLSGTSMAAPDAAGALACLLQSLAETRPELAAPERADLAEALLESTARVLTDSEGQIVSPRKQGAGLISLKTAAEAEACILTPVLSLGDDPDGRFTLKFRLRSLSDQTQRYNLKLIALRDATLPMYIIGNYEDEYDDEEIVAYFIKMNSVDVSRQVAVQGPDSVVLPAGEELEVELTLQADETLLETMREELDNGGFLEGYLALNKASERCDGGDSCPGKRFTDMPRPGSWSHTGIDFVLRNGLFSGTSATTFSPKGTMDRAMTVTVLYAMAGHPAVVSDSPFEDVPAGKYYTKAVTWAAENNIVSGYDDGHFMPKENITREQLAVILMRFAEYMGLDTGARAPLEDYPDVGRVHGWAMKAMSWAVAVGVLSGSSSNGQTILDPRANATREQVATILMRFVTRCLTPSNPAGELHVSFTAFVGSWDSAPVLEPHDWREVMDLDREIHEDAPYGGDETYAELGYTYLDAISGFDVNTDVNKAWLGMEADLDVGSFCGNYLGANPGGYTAYDADRSSLSHFSAFDTVFMEPMLLRNARHLIMTVVNPETGELYAVDDAKYLSKALWDPELECWRPAGSFRWDGADLDGEPVPDGTRVEIRFYASLAWGADELGAIAYEDLLEQGEAWLAWHFDLTVDDTAPVVDALGYDPQAKTLSFRLSDTRYLAKASLCPRFPLPAPGEETAIWSALYADEAPGQGHSLSVEAVEPGEYVLSVSDYAGNETTVLLSLGSGSRLCALHLICPEGCEPAGCDACYVSPGASVTLPGLAGKPREGDFYGWIAEPLEGSWSWDQLTEAAMDEEVHRPGDSAEIWDETWLYALLRTPAAYSDPAELITQTLEPAGDYSGPAAFGGYDRDAMAGLRLLDDNGRAWDSGAEDVLICQDPNPATLFRLTACEGGYTVCGAEGRYLALDGDALCFVEPEEAGVWQIVYDETMELFRVFSADSAEQYTLVYDVLKGLFRVVPAEQVDAELRWLTLYRPAVLDWSYFTAE